MFSHFNSFFVKKGINFNIFFHLNNPYMNDTLLAAIMPNKAFYDI